MECNENVDVLYEVETLFKKLESLPLEVKQAAYHKIHEKLSCQDKAVSQKCNSESKGIYNGTRCPQKRKRSNKKSKDDEDKKGAMFCFYGSENHDTEYVVKNIFTSRGRKTKRICCVQTNRGRFSNEEFKAEKTVVGVVDSEMPHSENIEDERKNSVDIKDVKGEIKTENVSTKSCGQLTDITTIDKPEKKLDLVIEESELIIDTETVLSDPTGSDIKRESVSPVSSAVSAVVTCNQCSFQTTSKALLRSHQRRHTGVRPYECQDCGKKFPQSSGLKVHMKRHRGQRDFPCDYSCDYRAYTKVDKIRHMTIHTGERNHVCQYCGKSFAKDSTLREHVKSVHERPNKHVCAKCGFTTFRANNLRVHISMRHRGEYNNFVCPVCGAKVKQRTAFLDHMRSHTGERPFSCHQCDSSFACLARLTVHRKAVHEPRQFNCKVCYKPFQTKHHLLRHLVIHTKEKPFGCPFCLYACNTQGNVTKHVKTVHNKPDFSYRKYKADQQVDADAKSLKTEWVEKGQKLTEEYLKNLSNKLGRDVTLNELQEKEADKNKRINEELEQVKLKRINRIRKHEHSYHSNRDASDNDVRLEEEAVDDPTSLLLNVSQQNPSGCEKVDADKVKNKELLPQDSQILSSMDVNELRSVSQTIYIQNSSDLQESSVEVEEFQAVLSQDGESSVGQVCQFVSNQNIQFCVNEDFLDDGSVPPLHVIYHNPETEKDCTEVDYSADQDQNYIDSNINFVAMKGDSEENPTVVVIINTDNPVI